MARRIGRRRLPSLADVMKEVEDEVEKEENIQYLQNKVIVGFDLVNRCPAVIDISKPRHVAIVGIQGCGKSVVLSRIAEYYHLQAKIVDVLNDKHGEWREKHKPNPYYMKVLRAGMRILNNRYPLEVFHPVMEQPFGWSNVTRYSPEFAYVNGTIPFSLKITEVAEVDWKKLLTITRLHRKRAIIWKLFYKYLEAKRRRNPEFRVTIDFIKECAQHGVLGRYALFDSQREALDTNVLERELESLWEEYIEPGVFEGKHCTNIQDMLYRDGVRTNLVLDWFNFEEGMTDESEKIRDVYLATFMINLFLWAKQKSETNDKTDSVLVLDEAQSILTTDAAPYTVRALKMIYSEGRKYGQHVIVAFQGEVQKVNSLIYENTDLLLLSSQNANRKSLNFLRDSHPDIFEWSGDMRDFQRLPQHVFLMVDKHNREMPWTIVLPYSQLSAISKQRVV